MESKNDEIAMKFVKITTKIAKFDSVRQFMIYTVRKLLDFFIFWEQNYCSKKVKLRHLKYYI